MAAEGDPSRPYHVEPGSTLLYPHRTTWVSGVALQSSSATWCDHRDEPLLLSAVHRGAPYRHIQRGSGTCVAAGELFAFISGWARTTAGGVGTSISGKIVAPRSTVRRPSTSTPRPRPPLAAATSSRLSRAAGRPAAGDGGADARTCTPPQHRRSTLGAALALTCGTDMHATSPSRTASLARRRKCVPVVDTQCSRPLLPSAARH